MTIPDAVPLRQTVIAGVLHWPEDRLDCSVVTGASPLLLS